MIYVKYSLNHYSDVIMRAMAHQNHLPHDCLLNRLFRHRSKKTPKPRVTGLCAGNSPVIDKFPAQRASNAENVSIWWRHHAFITMYVINHDMTWKISKIHMFFVYRDLSEKSQYTLCIWIYRTFCRFELHIWSEIWHKLAYEAKNFKPDHDSVSHVNRFRPQKHHWQCL